ncbi:N-glycosylase/DNA lyase [Candidatus Anstonella stagnisolia]|nr:N-glycosylase/DNA lyase [Candidatus Anstonella stagnisolia]
MRIREIKAAHLGKKKRIEERLSYFEKAGKGSGREIFAELCFCILTPQTKARVADAAIKKLLEEDRLYCADASEIEKSLLWAGVRFHRNKSKYIVLARKKFCGGDYCAILEILPKKESGQKKARDFIVANVLGIGKKEAGHFLRNVGHGSNLAILDRHILKNLESAGVIADVPRSLTHKRYDEIEKKMEGFCRKNKIPMHHLDLLFWSQETGEIFK